MTFEQVLQMLFVDQWLLTTFLVPSWTSFWAIYKGHWEWAFCSIVLSLCYSHYRPTDLSIRSIVREELDRRR